MAPNREEKLKASLVQTRNTIANKFRQIHNERVNQERELRSKYAPITDKLNKLIDVKDEIINKI